MRPQYEVGLGKHPDDLFSDEDLDVEDIDMEILLRTHVGASKAEDEAREENENKKEGDARERTRAGLQFCEEVWGTISASRKGNANHFEKGGR